MKLRLTVFTLALVIVLAGGSVIASEMNAQENSPYSTLVEKLSTRFGLNQDEVEDVFEEHKEEMHEVMEEKMIERLNQLVADGSLTEEQRQALLAKHEENEAFHDSLEGLSWEEKKEAVKDHHVEMKSWMDEQGIEAEFFGKIGHKGLRKGFKAGYRIAQ